MDRIEISEAFRNALSALHDIAGTLPEAFQRFPELAQSNAELFCVKDDDVRAVMTDKFIITLEPTEKLLNLIATVRAFKAERDLVEKSQIGARFERS